VRQGTIVERAWLAFAQIEAFASISAVDVARAVSVVLEDARERMQWRKSGEWESRQLWLAWADLGLPVDPQPWLGVEKIRAWILNQPLWACVFPRRGSPRFG
jgi:hypothetical protein